MRYVAYLVLGVIALMIAGFVAFLLPHHLQIRNVAITIPEQSAVLALKKDSTGPQSVEFVTTAEQRSDLGVLGHVVMLLTWAEGQQLIIDSGMNREDAIAFGKPLESIYGGDPTVTHGPFEEQRSDVLENLTGMVFTHLHTDHTYGAPAICDAQSGITIYQTKDQANIQNHLTAESQQLINGSACHRSALGDGLFKTIPGYPGIYAISAGGHTPGSTIYVVNTGDEQLIFSGDLTNDIHKIKHNEDKGFLYSYLAVPENTALLSRWRPWLNELDDLEGVAVFPSHDVRHLRASGLTELTCRSNDC